MRQSFRYQNHQLSYQLFGDHNKPHLILLHGFCEDASVWQQILPALTERYSVLLADLPGFGQSESWDGITLDDMAACVHEMISHATLYKPVMIGHSMGGYVTLAYHHLFPNRTAGLGLFHSTSLPDSDEKKENRLKTAAFIQENGAEAFAKVLVPTLFAPSSGAQTVIDEALNSGSSCSSAGLIHATHAMRQRPDHSTVLQQAKVPVLIIAGRHDAGIPVSVSAEQATYPNICLLHILENSGHMGMREEPEQAAYILNQFLQICFPETRII